VNGFPYWQFHNDKWLTGKISALDLDAQGLFLNFCMTAWSERGSFDICLTSLMLKFRKPKEWISETIKIMIEIGVLSHDGELYRIKFIDEQLGVLHEVREKRSKAGKASAKARSSKDCIIKSNIQEKSKEEKSSVLKSVQHEFNTCSTHVEQTNKQPKPKTFKQWTEEEFVSECNRVHDDKQILADDNEGSKFCLYWTEPTASGRMRFQLEKAWDTARRMVTWQSNANKRYK
jgi:hypothetical protein